MRILVVLMIAMVWLAPAVAQAGNYSHRCKRITRQIHHYEEVLELAEERGQELWVNGTMQHIDRLHAKRYKLCPDEYKEFIAARKAAAKTKKMMKTAAKLAIKYFTMGGF